MDRAVHVGKADCSSPELPQAVVVRVLCLHLLEGVEKVHHCILLQLHGAKNHREMKQRERMRERVCVCVCVGCKFSRASLCFVGTGRSKTDRLCDGFVKLCQNSVDGVSIVISRREGVIFRWQLHVSTLNEGMKQQPQTQGMNQ